MKKQPMSTGRKLTWNEEFIWVPLWKFIAPIIAYTVFFGVIFLILLGLVKLIKFMWLL